MPNINYHNFLPYTDMLIFNKSQLIYYMQMSYNRKASYFKYVINV